MKILFVVHGVPPKNIGGTEVAAAALANSLRRKGHQVRFFLPEQTNFEEVIRDFHPDVIHLHHLKNFPERFIDDIQNARIPYVVTLHDFWMFCAQIHLYPGEGVKTCRSSQEGNRCASCVLAAGFDALSAGTAFQAAGQKWVMARRRRIFNFLSAARALIAPSVFVRRRFSAEWPELRNRIHVIPNVIDSSPVKRLSKLRKDFRFGFFGGTAPVKGLHELMSAWEKISPAPQLWLYGDTRERFIGWIRAAGYQDLLNSSVRIGGMIPRNRIHEIYGSIDVMVVPSLTETFSLVAAESVRAGIPVLAADVGALPELVKNGRTGILYKAGNIVSFRKAISQVGRLNPTPTAAGQLRRTEESTLNSLLGLYSFPNRKQSVGAVGGIVKLPRLQSISASIRLALRLRDRGHPSKAADILKTAIARDPGQISARYHLARINLHTEQYKNAKILFHRILALIDRMGCPIGTEPYDAGSAFHLAELLWMNREVKNAEKYLRRVFKISPRHHRARLLWSELQHNLH